MVSGCKATAGCIAYVGISYLTQALQAGLGYAALQNAKGQYEVPTQASIAAEAAGFVKKTPANGTISLIYGTATVATRSSTTSTPSSRTTSRAARTAKNIRSVLEWAINPKYGNSTVVPVPGQLPAPALQGGGAVGEADPEHPVVTSVGGVAGSIPATPQAESIGKPPLPRRVADFFRRNEEHAWRGTRLGGRAAAARRARLRGHGPGGQGLARHPGQRLVLPLREELDLRQRLRRRRAHRRRGAPHGGRSSARGPSSGAPCVSSLIALVIALPLSIGAAFALTERLPGWISRPLGFTIEILAGIPSVVIGLWGILTFGPWLAKHVYPIIADHAPNVPVLRYFRNPVGSGEGLLSAGLVLALMIVPIITSTTRDLFQQVPPLPKEGASALGMTDWEVANKVTLPWVRSGIIGATVLGLGRALGETIAVAMIGGAVLHIPVEHLRAVHDGRRHDPDPARRRPHRRHRLRRGHPGRARPRARRHLGRRSTSIARLIITRTGRVGAPVGGA